MFIHRAKIQLRPDSFIEFSRKIREEIMPRLREQNGFCSGVTSIDTQWLTATGDTRWETRKNAEDYQQKVYFEILTILSEVIVEKPLTSIFEEAESVSKQTKSFDNKNSR